MHRALSLPVSTVFTVALDGIWSIKRNLPVGSMMPGQQSRNSSLPQAKYYSRHGGLRSKTLDPGGLRASAESTSLLASVRSHFVILGLKQSG